MIHLRPSLLLPLLPIVALAMAACQTERKPLTGFDTPPPGILLDSATGGTVLIWPIFDLPTDTQQIFRPRLNGQDTVIVTSQEGFYDYSKLYLQGWTGGWEQWLSGIPAGTYVLELVDSAGQSWGQSAPLSVVAGVSLFNPSGQLPAVVFANFDGLTGSWTIDPATQDSDAATDEITVTNLLDQDVVVERCLVTASSRASCTLVGTVAPAADFLTVETLAAVSSMADHQALFIHLGSDASQSYQRELVQGTGGTFGSTCQVERIVVHGERNPLNYGTGFTSFALSSCYGYGSGGN